MFLVELIKQLLELPVTLLIKYCNLLEQLV